MALTTWRELRSFVRFRMRIHSKLAFDAALIVVGLVPTFLGGHGVLDVVGWVLTAIGVWQAVGDWRERWRRHQKTRKVENEDYADQLAGCTFPAGFVPYVGKITSSADPRLAPEALAELNIRDSRPYVTSTAVNRLLDGSGNPLEVQGQPYEIPERLKEHQLRCVNMTKPHFNDGKIGLRTDVTEAALRTGRTVELQRTDYFSGAATNEVACDQFELATADHRGAPRILVAVGDMVVTGGRLATLAESELSNHIGVSTLVLSADDELVLQDQGDQYVSGNETGVGASGSLDWTDLDGIGDASFQMLLRRGMERESREELGARFAAEGGHTRLTGHARYLARGAKPEFFGISRSVTRCREMAPSRDEHRYVSGIRGRPFAPTAQGLADVLCELLDEGKERRRFSLSMVVCLRLARDWLAEADAAALATIGLSRER